MVASKKFSTKDCEIWLDEDVLFLSINDGAELDIEETTHAFRIYAELGIGPNNKVRQLIFAKNSAQMTPEGRKYVSDHGKNFFTASAIISNSLAIRLLVNFYNSFYKHDVPFKMFDSEEKALKWLENFK